MSERLVVVGGDAAGMAAAATAKRRAGDDLDVVVVERTGWVSYSACGIPYWVAGDVDGPDGLVARWPDQHRANGIDVRLHTEAVAVDMAAREVVVRTTGSDATERLGFDQLVLATGAEPRRPGVPGADADGVHGLQTLDDGCRLLATLAGLPSDRVSRAVVVGAGYIGIEMAEACVRRGLQVTVVDQAPAPMGTLDPDLGAHIEEAMTSMGMEVVMNAGVTAFETDAAGRVRAVLAAGRTFPADVVVLGLGVYPRSALAGDAGLPLGESGGIRVEPSGAVPGLDGVWAAGDVVEVWDRVAKQHRHMPLGTHANKLGRIVGRNLTGADEVFPGVVTTAITKVCDLEVARTGMSQQQADRAGLGAVSSTIETTTIAGYLPESQPMTVRLTAERTGGRLLGAQIVGRRGSAIRIDILATALWAEMTVHDVIDLDLAYAPPFSSAWDPVQVAARALQTRLA